MITFYSEIHTKRVNILLGRNAKSCNVRPGGGSTCINYCASEGSFLVYVYGTGSVAGTEWSGTHWASFYREIQLCNLFGNYDRCMRMVTSYLSIVTHVYGNLRLLGDNN
jgi:hypothetical protein